MKAKVEKGKKPAVRCAIYARVSTAHGLNMEFNSIEAQQECCQHYIATHVHEGWAQTHSFVDAAMSGGSMERPQLKALLAAVRKNEVDVIVLYKIDRFSRKLSDFLNMQEILAKHNCSLCSATESFDTSTVMGRAMLNLLGVFAEMERERIRERITDKIAATRARGFYAGGKPPLGYCVDDKKLYPNEHADTIKLIYELRLQGHYPTEIAHILNERGIVYPIACSSKSGRWPSRKIQDILRCATYAGYSPHKGTLHEGVHAPLVERAAWHRVQDMIKEQAPLTRATSKVDFALRGLMTCAACGATLMPTYTRKGDITHRYYLCRTRHTRGSDTCSCPRLNATQVEEHIKSELLFLGDDVNVVGCVQELLPHESAQRIWDGFGDMESLLGRLSPKQFGKLVKSVFSSIAFCHEQKAFILTKKKLK